MLTKIARTNYLVADVGEQQRFAERKDRQPALDHPQLERPFHQLDGVPVDYGPRLERLVRQISAQQEFGFVSHRAPVTATKTDGIGDVLRWRTEAAPDRV